MATVTMSKLLTMDDFEDMKQKHHNMSSFEMLLQVASVAAKKYDLATNNVSCKRAQTMIKEKMNTIRFVIRRRRNEEQNLTSYVIKAPSKIHHESNDLTDEDLTHENLIKEEKQKVQNSKKDTLKRKLEDTRSNEEWIEAMEIKRMKMKKKSKEGRQNPPPPSLAKEFERKIIDEYGGTRIIKVIQKSLCRTDVSKGHSRVSIPCSQVESFKFLDDEEMTHLRLGQSITVPLIHTPRRNGVFLPLAETSLEFGQWDEHKYKNDLQKVSYQYVLRTNWNTIVSRDELKQGDTIQIWAFRNAHNKLCMALVKL